MLISNGDGTYTAGPLDVLCILHNVEAGTYHAAFFEEKPMPGPVPDWRELKLVRLKSHGHHTEGAPTLEGALEHLDELVAKIQVNPENIWRDRDRVEAWDGVPGIVWMVPNWRVEPHPEPRPLDLRLEIRGG